MNAVFLLPLLFAAVMSYPGYPSQKRVSIPVFRAPVYPSYHPEPAPEETKEAKSDDAGHSHSFTSYYVAQPQREVEEREEEHSTYGGHQEAKSAAKVEVEVEEKKASKSSGYGGYGEEHGTEKLRVSNEELSEAVEKLNEQLSALTSEVKSRLEEAEEIERAKPKKTEEEEHEEEEHSNGGYGSSGKKSSHQRITIKTVPAPQHSYYH